MKEADLTRCCSAFCGISRVGGWRASESLSLRLAFTLYSEDEVLYQVVCFMDDFVMWKGRGCYFCLYVLGNVGGVVFSSEGDDGWMEIPKRWGSSCFLRSLYQWIDRVEVLVLGDWCDV